ncbi:DUF1624 domain-containing protein [Frankia sp. CNm7]|uniref:DUF1624 domain-containing protein n=1 Tax=Frankia nepalensis TaxID=1836974 RepID=A0A937RG45_9ACTN|nr:heparan-alpha-glucosaminide N-acetyltransferase domain-containing protein [Frankia nepalensis]MBL7501403.1 DUF1624 domain-containing protein [Frankia nepalensis]MBL7511930.1 DUF1624 domain-containing protein [Frankia nepalensis]MBL7523429.1 DUF1624 domain-containing protein [Frankia nepalensis]MBL7628249.1 DUF1624 domain-containing protein [Frankia nepalensis]
MSDVPERAPWGAVPAPAPASASAVASAAVTRGRIVGVDAARGAALLGMAATHIVPELSDDGELTTAHLIAGGRAAAAFALLAGVALTLVTARSAHPRGSTFIRALCIGIVGLVLGMTQTPLAVILPYYAVYFLLALPLLRAPRWVLAAVVAGAFAVEPVLSQLVRPHLPDPLLTNPSLSTPFLSPVNLTLTLTLTGYYPALAWIGYLAAGMLIGRLDLRSARVAGWLVGGGAALAVAAAGLSSLLLGPLGGRDALLASDSVIPGVGLMSAQDVGHVLDGGGLYGSTPTQSWWWLAVDSPHTTAPLDLLHTTGTAAALLGVALLVAHLGAAGRVALWPLAGLGAMTLTWYTLHAWLMSTDLSQGGGYDELYLRQIIPALVIASLWRLTGLRGPLEAAVAAFVQVATTGVSPPAGDGRGRGAGDRPGDGGR